MKNTDIYSHLNKEQHLAVTHKQSPLLVLAGAGSGKTRILTTRIIHMIQEGISPSDILALTFTNKAANEMKSRIMNHIQFGVSIGTFHSVCLKILRSHAKKISLSPDFNIYDDQDQLAIIKESMKELDIDVKVINPKGIRQSIGRCKDSLISPTSPEVNKYGVELFAPIYQKYSQKLLAYNGVDFGDLIFKTVILFKNHPEVLSAYQENYKYILIDEYQDTNSAQYTFIKMLAHSGQNITAVGDPDQSIYEWRGATIENILKFELDFSKAKTIRLEQNYRSTNTILSAANAIIANNINRKSKNLWSQKGKGEKIVLYRAYGERWEARYLVDNILSLIKLGYHLNQIVGFYRTHSQSRVFEEELMRNNIPYKIVGGLKFYARKEIKDLIAFLKVVHNPEDEISLLRIINQPRRGIGKALIAKVHDFALRNNFSFYASIPSYIKSLKKISSGAKGLLSFYEMIQKLRVESKALDLCQLIENIIERTNYVGTLEAENTVEAKSRIENIKEFLGSIYEFHERFTASDNVDRNENASELQMYLEFISLQSDIDNFYEADETFTLMTLHGAKGLEFPVVFILGMEEGILPHQNALNASDRELEEERRLCYVGFTRAMQRLYLSYSTSRKIYGSERRQIPSRFLYEIPDHLMTQSMQKLEKRIDHRTDPFHPDYQESVFE